jgi:hypothetical protein
MRSLEEIKKTSGISIKKEEYNCFGGSVFKTIKYKKSGVQFYDPLNFIFSVAGGFEHLSVSTPTRCPTWEEMQFMKEVFWKDDEVCYQLHPAKENYINNHPYCLHIWRKIDQDPPLPPLGMVGIKSGATVEDMTELMNLVDQRDRWKEDFEKASKGE